jgi:hypothetical protein
LSMPMSRRFELCCVRSTISSLRPTTAM